MELKTDDLYNTTTKSLFKGALDDLRSMLEAEYAHYTPEAPDDLTKTETISEDVPEIPVDTEAA